MTDNTMLSQTAEVDKASVQPFPKSRKVYIQGSRPDIQVPMREISLDATPTDMGGEVNEPLYVYDTSGLYTDPAADIDVRTGLPALRQNWILEREDTEQLDGMTSEYGRVREADLRLDHLRFDLQRKPRRAQAGKNVSQLHYARKGMITPEMEYIAIRENMKLAKSKADGNVVAQQHPGHSFGAKLPDEITQIGRAHV